MITKIILKNFKGIDAEHNVGRINLITGPNMAGKSAVAMAAELAIHGHVRVPDKNDPIKRPADIFDAFAGPGAKKMEVGVEIDEKMVVGRRFQRSGDKTTHTKTINGQKMSDTDFERAVIANGDPFVFNLQSFMALSDNKKAETLFEKFSPSDGNIHRLEDDINRLAGVEKKLRLELSAARIQSETNRNILAQNGFDPDDLETVRKKISDGLCDLEKELDAIKFAEADERRKAEAEKPKVEENIPSDKNGNSSGTEPSGMPSRIGVPEDTKNGDNAHTVEKASDKPADEFLPNPESCMPERVSELEGAIRKAIAVMAEVGCSCAAKIILKGVLR